jgi:hypothetical protein
MNANERLSPRLLATPRPRIQSLPAEVFMLIAAYLNATQIVQLSVVCRLFHSAVRQWKLTTDTPLSNLLRNHGYYWLLNEGVYFSSTYSGAATAVELQYNAESFTCTSSESELWQQGAASDGDAALTASALIHQRSHAATVMVGRLIYQFGGRVGAGMIRTRSCHVIDPLARSARPLPPMMCVRSASAAAAVGARIYIFGGCDGTSEQNTMEVFDTTTESWLVVTSSSSCGHQHWRNPLHDVGGDTVPTTRCARMPFSINEHCAVAVAPHYVVLLGGSVNRYLPTEASIASVRLFDVTTCTWEDLGDMPDSRLLGCAAYRCHQGRHTITYCGGKRLVRQEGASSSDSTTMVLTWVGDGVASMREAQWTTNQFSGGVLVLNSVSVQYNYFDPQCVGATPLRAVMGVHAYTAELATKGTPFRWRRLANTPSGTIYGVCCVK